MAEKLNDSQKRELKQYCRKHDDTGFDNIAKLFSERFGIQLTRDEVYAMYLDLLTGRGP